MPERGIFRLSRRLPDWADPIIDAVLLVERLAPLVLAVLVFAGGLILLLSGAGPEVFARKAVLRDIIPLPFAEASHLSASLTGLALIVLSRGLALRMAQARYAAMAVLIAGAAFVLIKGLDWEEAGLLLLVAGALAASRHAFYRRGDWHAFRPTPMWLGIMALTLVAVTLIGLIGFRNVSYRTELWWSFAWSGDAPRFLRATLVVAIVVVALTMNVIINRPPRARPARVAVPDAVRRISETCADSIVQVAHLGDKKFLVSPDQDAFLMYAVSGSSWVCLGGPFGNPQAGEALFWRLAELADRAGGRPVYYGVSPDAVLRLLDFGHVILKTGEVALVDLAKFTLEGPDRKDLRYARSRATRDGLSFHVLPRAEVPAHMGRLRHVSDAWLAGRKGREKGFSLGRFDPQYMAEFDVAIMEKEGEIIAFANLWRSGARHEMSIDLMRHLSGQTPVLMDALMVETILYAQSQGYEKFNLGGAPLSGLKHHPLASVWNRIGTLAYRRGDEFYSFEGLRAFKKKFGPDWSPRYMTCPGGMSIPRALIDVALLISRPKSSLVRLPE